MICLNFEIGISDMETFYKLSMQRQISPTGHSTQLEDGKMCLCSRTCRITLVASSLFLSFRRFYDG